MGRRRVRLDEQQRRELTELVRESPKPYLRERAAAILKVAGEESAHRVALRGLLVRRDPDTVYGWLDRFAAEGVAGLTIRPGRGRKPRLSPPGRGRAGGAGGRAAGTAGE